MTAGRKLWQGLSQFSGPQLSPGFNLWRDFMRWQRVLNTVLRPLELTQPQFAILAVVGWMTRESDGVTQQDLVDFLGLDRMHISQVASRLESDGRLLRKGGQKDKRVKQLQLTAAGQALLAKAMPLVEAHDAAFFAAKG
jgi:DNA-binding MarR family transcriptional regulator